MQIVELCFCLIARLLLKHSGALQVKSQVTVCQREEIYNYLSISETELKATAPTGSLDRQVKTQNIFGFNTS